MTPEELELLLSSNPIDSTGIDPLLGEQAGIGTAERWDGKDYYIPLFISSDMAFSDANGNGNAGVTLQILNDTRNDGDNVFIIRLQDATPTLGFANDGVFEFNEAPTGVTYFSEGDYQYHQTDLELTTNTTYQTAIVLIQDDDSPNNRINGTGSADNRAGTNGRDTIRLYGGSDTANAGGGNDIILGEAGNDTLRGEDGNDVLFGGWGNDSLLGGNNSDILYGGIDSDTLDGGAGNDEIFGDEGNDRLEGGSGSDTLDGGAGSDTLIGGTDNDVYIIKDPGDQIIDSRGTGIETVEVYNQFSYTLGEGLDFLNLRDNVSNGFGNDINNRIVGNQLDNFLRGFEGQDTLEGGYGSDEIVGDAGNDVLYAGVVIVSPDGSISHFDFISSNNNLIGGFGNDTLYSSDGSDRLNGYGTVVNNNSQYDTLMGGAGSDTFVLGSAAGVFYNETGDGYAVITDWDAPSGAGDTVFDRIEVRGSISQYRLDKVRNVVGGAGIDTEIFYVPTGDRIAIVQDTTNVQLNRDFVFL